MNNTLQNGFRLLEMLADNGGEMSVTELAAQASLPPSHVCRLLKTLVQYFNAGELKLLLGQPQSMSHGLNLQSGGCHHLCWFTLPWAQDIYTQANARLHRSGQKNRVIVHRLLARKTVDEIVAKALTSKTRVQNALLDALRRSTPHR